MRIDSSGRVGIGTSSPSDILELTAGSSNFGLLVNNASGNPSRVTLTNSEGSGYIDQNNNTMRFNQSGSVDVTIDSSGNVGIGVEPTTSYGKTLQIHNPAATGSNLRLTNSGSGSGVNNGFEIIQIGANNYLVNRESGFMAFSTSSEERMRIDASGNLLVGQTVGNVYNQSSVSGLKLDGANGNIQTARANNESLLLNRYGSDGDIAKFYKDGAPVGSIGTGSGLLTIGTGTGNLLFENALVAPCSTSALGASNGVVDLGAGTRRFKDLHLSGGISIGDAGTPNGTSIYGASFISYSNSRKNLLMATSSTAENFHIRFFNPNGLVGDIRTSGSATAYNTSSDYRLKTDAQPMTGASARVQALNPINFEWIASGDRVDGFLAHEAQAVVPESVTGTKDAMMDEEYEVTPAVLDDDGNETTAAVMGTRSVPDMQGIDQSKLVPLLTAALQEALTKIDAMETRIAALEG
jgi:hypothetical protein